MGLKPGYKKTEVGVIPEDWGTRPCFAISDFITVGIVVRPTQYYVQEGVPALRSANIREDGIDDSDMVFISEKANAELSKSKVRAGDVLTVRTGYPGTSAVVSRNFEGSNCIDILITRPSRTVNSEYLAAWINSSFGKDQVLRNMGGLAQQHFNVADLRNLVVALPPLPEQDAIAEALSDADALIESLEELIAKRRHLKQGATRELLRPKDGWATKTLGRLATLINGRAYSITEWETRGIPVIRLQNLTGHGDTYYYSNLELPEKQYCHRDDLLFMWSATFGPIIWRGPKAIFHYHIWKIECQPKTLNKEYLYHLLSDITERLKSNSSRGGTMLHLTKSGMESTEISIPDYGEQETIASILSDMDSEIAALQAKVAKARQIKQGMMHNLLTGKIRLV